MIGCVDGIFRDIPSLDAHFKVGNGSMTNQQAVQRSIDTLQRIYAVVAGLAINEALKRVFLQDGKGDFAFHTVNLPELVAFILTVVPFVHGMNRHLDKTLTASLEQNNPKLLAYLLIDFFRVHHRTVAAVRPRRHRNRQQQILLLVHRAASSRRGLGTCHVPDYQICRLSVVKGERGGRNSDGFGPLAHPRSESPRAGMGTRATCHCPNTL
jgi:hypothetical protein